MPKKPTKCNGKSFDDFLAEKLERIEHFLNLLLHKENEIMGQEIDLKAAISAIAQQLTRLQADVKLIVDKQTTAGNIPDEDIQALAAVATGLGDAADSIESVVNPPPVA